MRTTEIIIANKCKRGSTDGAILYATRMGRSKLFMIPFSLIQSKEDTIIPVNDMHNEPAIAFTIPIWFYEKIESDLKSMFEHDVILPKPK